VESEKKWREIFHKIPFIKLPDGCLISIRPPITMADARFIVKRPDGNEISIYLDLHDNLGHCGEPHWEVYPDVDGSNSRCKMDDVETLVRIIMWAKEET
jgi:hypothetical protein